MTSLETLITKYNSDKNNYGYPKVYESIFRNFKDKPINLLEIGIGTMTPGAHSTMVHVYGENGNYKPGASLRAFRDYFPNGNIYGGDVQLDCMFSEERINTLLFNSLVKEECDNALKDLQFDIIIDDGDHTNSSQEATFRNLWSRIKPGGYYFIEDVGCTYINLDEHNVREKSANLDSYDWYGMDLVSESIKYNNKRSDFINFINFELAKMDSDKS
jgi:hypothetical protein